MSLPVNLDPKKGASTMATSPAAEVTMRVGFLFLDGHLYVC